MGSNVSRQSGKGLSGRRTQSSGNLCNGAKILGPSVNKLLSSCGGRGVSRRDRNKFSGSLPNNLDDKDGRSGERSPESLYSSSTTNGDVYLPTDSRNIETLFRKIEKVSPYGREISYERGSERTPQAEQPPQQLGSEQLGSEQPGSEQPGSEQPPRQFPATPSTSYSFITKDNTFEARIEKNSRGLGLSVAGGSDTAENFPGLIRIKRMFPNEPAWESQKLQIGDVILAANGVPITGLTNNEALEVLRMTPNNVILSVCRPPGHLLSMPPPSVCAPPPPPKRRDPAHVVTSSQLNTTSMLLLPKLTAGSQEFEIVLRKINGSLGFMLRKEERSALGHRVRALVREPALSDGRIRPGDRIVMVNDVDVTALSHEEAVMYLRQCGEEVRLRLYREPVQTTQSTLSPTESCTTFRPKPALRKEAMDMLSDLAVKKMSPTESTSSSGRTRLRGTSPSSSPRRRKAIKTPSDEKTERPGSQDPRREKKRVSFLETEREEDTDSIITVISTSDILRSAARVCPSSGVRRREVCLEPSSMPPMTKSSSRFRHKSPAYQSAHPAVRSETEEIEERVIPSKLYGDGSGPKGLLKWKGVILVPEDDEIRDVYPKSDENYEILTVELCRGWNTRLGFSLRSRGTATYVSAVYADSVAARDGRLRYGDEVIMINEESTERMTTADVIDLLRGARGTIAITVRRKRKRDPPPNTER